MTNVLTALLVNAAVFSVLFLIMLAVRRLIGKRLSPTLMLILWAVVVIKLLIPYGFESDIAVFAARQTVAAASADALVGDHIGMPATQNNISADTSQPENVTADSGLGSHMDTKDPSTQTASLVPAAPVDWRLLAVGVWAAGALAVAAVHGIGSLNIRRRIRHAQLRIPDHVRVVFEECRARLGIKRRVGLTVQSAFGMPVMMGALRPCLVLPENAPGLERQALRHIMLHELSHFKRGDLLLIWALNLLSAVYWFNPITWLCFKLIRDDIETACDHNVFKIVGHSSRLDYIDTILHFAGSDKQQRLAAAMALSHRRYAMEKRISGMYKAARTQFAGRCAAVCVALLMLCTSGLTACQPTPVKPVVVQRDEVEQIIAETPVPEAAYEVPSHITDSAEDGEMTVNIDADVIAPGVSAYPVVRFEPLVLSQERVDELVRYFAGDRRLRNPGLLTKKDYEDALIQAKLGQLVDGKYVVNDDSQRMVAVLEETIRNAPEDAPKVYCDATLTCKTNSNGSIDMNTSNNYLDVEIEDEKGSKAGVIYFRNYVENESNATEFSFLTVNYTPETFLSALVEEDRHKKEEYDPDVLAKDTYLLDQMKNNQERYDKLVSAECNVSKEDAQATAQKAIDDLKITDMQLIGAERALLEDTGKGGYVFSYVRQSGGIAGFQRMYWSSAPADTPPEYRPPFEQESVTILVTDDGIQSFLWMGCAQAVEKVSQNVKMLPFEEVIEKLKQRVFIECAYEAGFDTTQNITINVNTAELRVGYINVKDRLSEALLIPVWVFQTTKKITVNDGRAFTSNSDVYVFSAIDGGYIKLD